MKFTTIAKISKYAFNIQRLKVMLAIAHIAKARSMCSSIISKASIGYECA
jgi:hypothetical protein